MLLPWEHHREVFVALSPGHDVHHRLFVALRYRHGLIELGKEPLAGFLPFSAYDEGGAGVVFYDGQRGVGGWLCDGLQLAGEVLPLPLQGQQSCGACLQMGMVGSRCTASRTIVEHRQLRMLHQQGEHLAVHGLDALWLVAACGQREVHGQDGEGVHQQFVVAAGDAHLLLGPVLLAKEAGTLLQRLFGDVGTSGANASGVPLGQQRQLTHMQLLRLCVGQVAVAQQCLGPERQLAVEESLQRRALLDGLPVFLAVHALTGQYLHGAQTVFVEIVAVHALYAQGGIAVALPAAAEVKLLIDAPDAVAP